MQLKPTDPDLETIVRRINRGDIDLQPDFQRGEVWQTSKKQHLVDSVLRNWHIPPIHLVVKQDARQEVLDGQQRLVSIRDFVAGHFGVDGHIPPHDPQIAALHGLKYDDLPGHVRRQFDAFTVRVYLLTDYKPEEPGELFFRLNQPVALTTAEKRNAFLGPARDQVKATVEYMRDYIGESRIGFTNRRMAYDDVIAKFLFLCEVGRIDRRVSGTDLSNRFRSVKPFDERHVALARKCLEALFCHPIESDQYTRLNKATLLTWMLFVARIMTVGRSADAIAELSKSIFEFFLAFHQVRRDAVDANISSMPSEELLHALYTSRASFRVADSSSVIIRDLVLWILFDSRYPNLKCAEALPLDEQNTLHAMQKVLGSHASGDRSERIENLAAAMPWGHLQ